MKRKSDITLRKVFDDSLYNAEFGLTRNYILDAMEKFAYQEAITKMFLFARWIATCYADEHIDDNMISQHEEGFNPCEAISVLNRESGYWWKTKLKHFNEVVYPNYMKNGTADETEKFLTDISMNYKDPKTIN